MNILLTFLALIVLLLIETIIFMWQGVLLSGNEVSMTQGIWASLPSILKLSAYTLALPLAFKFIYTWVKGNWYNALMRLFIVIAGSIAFVVWFFIIDIYGYNDLNIDASMLSLVADKSGEALANMSFIKGLSILILLCLLVLCLYKIVGKLYKSKKHDPVFYFPIRPSAAVRAMHSIFIVLTFTAALYLLNGKAPNISMPSFDFETAKAEDKEEDGSMDEGNVEEALKELYAMPHALGLDKEEAYEHPRPQMITDKRPNVIILLLPGFTSSTCKVLDANADASSMPFTNKMYDNGIGFTQLYANNADVKAEIPNLSLITKTLKDNGYDTEEFKSAEDNQKQLNLVYNSIEEGRNNGIGRAGKPFLKVVHTSSAKDNTVTYTDACLKKFIGKLWYTPTWKNTLIIAMGETGKPEDTKRLEDPESYHIPMFWTGGVIKAHGHVDILCQQADLAATLLGQMGINSDKLTLSNNIFDRTIPHFAFFSNGDSFGFLTDSIRYVQDKEGKAIASTNDPEGKAKKWGQACLRSYAAYKTE